MLRRTRSTLSQAAVGLLLAGSAALVPAAGDSGSLHGGLFGGLYGESYAANVAGLEIVGISLYREAERDIFVAGLLLPPERAGANPLNMPPPRAMEYRIVGERLSADGFCASILLQAELASPRQPPESVIGALNVINRKLKGPLKRGDQFAIYHTRRDDTVFLLNNQELHRVTGSSAFNFLLNGWAGEDAAAGFRDSLLAGATDERMTTIFHELAPTVDRVAVVRGWLAVPPGAERDPTLPVTMRGAVERSGRAETQTSNAMDTDARRSRDAVL